MAADELNVAEIEAWLREHGIIDPNYSGPVRLTATTDEGTATVTINV